MIEKHTLQDLIYHGRLAILEVDIYFDFVSGKGNLRKLHKLRSLQKTLKDLMNDLEDYLDVYNMMIMRDEDSIYRYEDELFDLMRLVSKLIKDIRSLT